MPVIPNASEWCFSFSVWMEPDSFVHFVSAAAAALIILDSARGGRAFCKTRGRPVHNSCFSPCLLVFVSCEAMLRALESLTERRWQHIFAQRSKHEWSSHDGLSLHIWKPLQWKKCMLVASGVASSQKEKGSTPRDTTSSYFWAQRDVTRRARRGQSAGRRAYEKADNKQRGSRCCLSGLSAWLQSPGLAVVELRGLTNSSKRPCASWREEVRGFAVGGVGGQSCVLPVSSGLWAMWRFVRRNADGF